MALYEHTFIATPELSANELDSLNEKIASILEKNGSKIIKKEDWGIRTLAYPIKKNTKGNYNNLYIDGNNKIIKELEQFERYDERRNKISIINNISKKKLNKFREFKIIISNDQELDLENENSFIEKVKKIFFEKRNLDATIKRNSYGPSIDEIFFYDENKQLNTDLCSTGEQKSLLLSIILSCGWIYKDENINFILLFDEISSHIDQKNIEKFFAEVAKFETQAWYTGTDKNLFQAIENKAFFIDLA